MMWKILTGAAPVAFGLALMMTPLGGLGSFGLGSSNFEATVDQPVAIVSSAIADMEMNALARDGMARSFFVRRQRNRDGGYSWYLMKDGDVALEMLARLAPADGGRGTVVTGEVRPGKGRIASGAVRTAFNEMLAAELLEVAPLAKRMEPTEIARRQRAAAGKMGVLQLISDPAAVDAVRESVTADFDDSATAAGAMSDVQAMRTISDSAPAASPSPPQTPPPVSFEPGKPMVDLGGG